MIVVIDPRSSRGVFARILERDDEVLVFDEEGNVVVIYKILEVDRAECP